MLVALQLVDVAGVPLNVTVLVPCVAPKLAPAIVTVAPTGPCVRPRLVILGPADVTVKGRPLLATADTVTTTLPVTAAAGTLTVMLVAAQVEAVPAKATPKVTVLAPWLVPKPVPVMVIGIPVAPEAGFRLVMFGVTAKLKPLLASPPTVTTTLPVRAAAGTSTVMLVAVQVNAAPAEAPPKVTVLVPWVVPKFVPVMVMGVPTVPEA